MKYTKHDEVTRIYVKIKNGRIHLTLNDDLGFTAVICYDDGRIEKMDTFYSNNYKEYNDLIMKLLEVI